MTRNYPDQSRASQRVPLEEAQPPPYYDATAGDTFPPRYSDAEEADMGGTNGEPDISKDPGAESSDLEEAESYSDQTPSPTSRRYWRLCLVVFTLLIGLRLTIPVVAGSFSPENPSEKQKPISAPQPPTSEKTSDPSRETYIRETSRSLGGFYSLLDLLSISTTSGSINVAVSPQAADSSNPKPATLLIKSQSGSVNANVPINGGGNGIPKRDYITEIESHSGSVSGTYILGSRSEFVSNSGGVHLSVLPVFPSSSSSSSSERMEFKTETGSGTHNIDVHSPFNDRGKAITQMVSSHVSRSGSFNLRYPREWEGEIEVRTGSGSASVSGQGVRVLEQGRGWVRAVKGGGKGSSVKVEGGSGSVSLRIG